MHKVLASTYSFPSPKHYTGLTLAEVSAVIHQMAQIHAVSTAMFMSGDDTGSVTGSDTNSGLTESLKSLERSDDATQAITEELDLVFRSLGTIYILRLHLKRVGGPSNVDKV